MDKPLFRKLICGLAFLLFLLPTGVKAQIELSSGIDMSYPLLFNSGNNKLYYNQLSFGIRGGISYKPTGTQFFPTLYYSLGQTHLPLKDLGDIVSSLALRYQNVLLNGNLVITFENGNNLYVTVGIGISNLKAKYPDLSGPNALTMSSFIDSTGNITKTNPAVALGFEYVYGGAVNRSVYLSLGVSIMDIILLDKQNTYKISVTDAQNNTQTFIADLSGHALVPNFNITLHYMLGKEVIFWQKKKSSYYL
jgi:hypothetical protein